MTENEAFNLINNLDWEDKKRRFAPQWSLVTYSRKGVIEDVQRFKESPQTKEQIEILKRFPKSCQFTSWPGQLGTIEKLIQKIQETIRDLAIIESEENQGKRWVHVEAKARTKHT